MSPEAWNVLLGGGGLMSLAAALLVFFATRGKTRTDARTALDQRIDQRMKAELERVYARLDESDRRAEDDRLQEARRTSAVTRILRAIARQWPNPDGPDLDPADIAEIEDTIPPAWIRRNPFPKETS